MATLKIISDRDCKLYIDQEFICNMSANKLIKHEIDPGIYLIDVMANEGSLSCCEKSFDLEIADNKQQILKRIAFASSIDKINEKNYNENEENKFDVIRYGIIKKGGKYGILDQNNNLIADSIYDEIREISCKRDLLRDSYYELYAYVIRKESKEGVLALDGNIIIPCEYDKILPKMGWDDKYVSFYVVENNRKKAIWSIHGKILSGFLFEEIKSNEIGYYEHEVVLWLTKESKIALALLREFDNFSYKTDFIIDECLEKESKQGEFYVVRKKNNLGIINNEGNVLLDFKCEDLEYVDCKKTLLKVKIDGKWGVLTHFKPFIASIYDEIKPIEIDKGTYFANVNSYICVNKKCKSILDKNGRELIKECDYDIVKVIYNNDLVVGMIVKKNNLEGFLNPKGNLLIPCVYDSITPCVNQDNEIIAYIISMNGKKGAIDICQNILVKTEFDVVFFGCTEKNNVLLYRNETNSLLEPLSAMIIELHKEVALEATRASSAESELKKNGY